MRFGTKLVQFDASPGDPHRPLATPIYQTATFEQESVDRFGAYNYSRSGNPTRQVLEEQLAHLEGGTAGFAFVSGMAAITAVTQLLPAGSEILADWDIYGGTSRLFANVLPRAGITVRTVDATDPEAIVRHIGPTTKLIFVESPTNPLLRILDLQTISTIARHNGLLFCVDNSTMSPYLQNPLALGADLVLHSGTKFLSGHSDVTAGVLVANDDTLASELRSLQNTTGTALGPLDSFLLLRGIKTLKIRLDSQQRSARTIAEALSSHHTVHKVHYPGLPTHPGYAIHARQTRGAGSVISFALKSDDHAKLLAERLSLFKIAVSFGSVSSTISMPFFMSHASVPEEARASRGISPNLLRISIGIEDIDDLMIDLVTQLDLLN